VNRMYQLGACLESSKKYSKANSNAEVGSLVFSLGEKWIPVLQVDPVI
jgi:hypothetical protein